MNPRDYVFWGVLMIIGLLAIPGGIAQAPAGEELEEILFGEGNEGRILRYQIGDTTRNEPGDFGANFTFFKLHTHDLGPTSPVLRIDIVSTYTIQPDSDGVWHYQLSLDGNDVDDCAWQLVTTDPGGFLAGDLVIFGPFRVSCTVGPEITAGWDESRLVGFNITRTVVSGAPTVPVAGVVNVVTERADFVITSTPTNFEQLTGLSALEFLIFPALSFVGIMLWSRSTDEAVRVFGALLSLLSGVLLLTFALFIGVGESWVGTVAFSAVLMVVGAYLIIRQSIDALGGP